MRNRYESVFSDRHRWIQMQFMAFQEVHPKATKAQLKKAFKLILKKTAKEGKQS